MKKVLLLILAFATASISAEAQQGVQAYVSASGYLIYSAPVYNTGTDGYAFDFENDYIEGHLIGWKTIDADRKSVV